MNSRSSSCNDLIRYIRSHPAFEELMDQVESPPMPVYSPGRKGNLDRNELDWAYVSGRLKQHEHWTVLLRGAPQRVPEGEAKGE